MTQFTRRVHRARERLSAWGQQWPQVWSMVDDARTQLSHAWPPYVYLSLPAASAVLTEHQRRAGNPPPDRGGKIGNQSSQAAMLAGLAAWRMTQGIYRYDPALYAALVDTHMSGDVPADVLRRLPEWCVYLELQGIALPTRGGAAVVAQGVWAWLDHDETAHHDLLCLWWDTEPAARGITFVPLVGSIRDSADSVLRDWARAHAEGAADLPPAPGLRAAYESTLPPVLSLLLYLCLQRPDITRRGVPAMPANPEPVRTRRDGWRLFPADGPREWDVGVRIGAALRSAYQREQTGVEAAPSGKHVRPHVRRAHWHTILSGPRLREDGTAIPSALRTSDLRWMPPLAINVDDVDSLPAVVRPVRPA